MVRRVRPQHVLAAFAAAFAAACADKAPVAPTLASSAEPSLQVRGGTTAEAGRYVVGVGATGLPASAVMMSGGRIVDSVPSLGAVVVDGVTNPSALQQVAGVRYVQAEFEVNLDHQVVGAPVDAAAISPDPAATPWYTSGVQWDIKAMKADEAWAMGAYGEGATICIGDSGVDNAHQELNGGKVLARANFVTTAGQNGAGQVNDGNGHGSHVAGEAAGRGTVVAGVAPGASILGARVLNNAGSGSETGIVNGINWCVQQGAHVINLSLGGIRYRGQPSFITSPALYGTAIKNATDAGVVVIVSAGNSNISLPNPAQLIMPAQVPGTMIVGSTGPVSKVGTFPLGGNPTVMPRAVPNWNAFDAEQMWQGVDGKAFYSNFGTAVDVFAPGGRGGIPFHFQWYYVAPGGFQGNAKDNIYGVCSSTTSQTGNVNNAGAPGASGSCNGQTNRYIAYAGTSMAAPHVAGMAAILYAELGNVRSVANRARVMNCIKSTTDNIGPATTFGGGRVNVKKAVEALRANQC